MYNHEDKKAGKYPPNLLCIENECVNKKQFAMLNGNNTLKINNGNNNSEYIIPIYTYSGGLDGNVRYDGIHTGLDIIEDQFLFLSV